MTSANSLCDLQLRTIWHHSVDLLQRGFTLGSIITTSGPDLRKRRRYVYNLDSCLCGEEIRCWKMSGRTAYACEACQKPPQPMETSTVTPFASSCAVEALENRLPSAMRVVELREALAKRKLPTTGCKAELIERLQSDEVSASPGQTHKRTKSPQSASKTTGRPRRRKATLSIPGSAHLMPVTAVDAAMDKIAAGENRAVEHVAEADMGTIALAARSSVSTQTRGQQRQQQQQRKPLTFFSRSLRPSKIARKATMFSVPLRAFSTTAKDTAIHSTSKSASLMSCDGIPRWACALLIIAKIYLQAFGCVDETQLRQLSRVSRCCSCGTLRPWAMQFGCKFDTSIFQHRVHREPGDDFQAPGIRWHFPPRPRLVLDIAE